MSSTTSSASAEPTLAALAAEDEPCMRVIEPDSAQHGYFRELWAYRALIYQMARRDIRLRYTQTLLGLGWPIVQPLLSMLVLTFVFGRVAGLHAPSDVPYAVLVLTGLLPWQLFATGLTSVGLSMLISSELLSRVYFPRLVLPIRALAVALHNALISSALLLGVMLVNGIVPGPRVLMLVPLLGITSLFALALGLFLSIWNAVYRDFLHLLPFLLQLVMYVSPVGFESAAIPPEYHWVSALNPLAALIDACRYALLPGHTLDWAACARSTAVIFVLLMAGIRFFRRYEADVVERI